jgi:hypothetical protein
MQAAVHKPKPSPATLSPATAKPSHDTDIMTTGH